MDLLLMLKGPTEGEKAAVDLLLGSPSSGWDGGSRESRDEHIAFGGREARQRRHLLLPALHAVNDAIGWVSDGALNYICERLTVPPAEAYGVLSFYALFSTRPRPPRVAHVCTDIACRVAGADELAASLGATLDTAEAAWEPAPCLGQCERAPAVFIKRAGGGSESLGRASAEDVATALSAEPSSGPAPVAAPQTVEPRGPALQLLRRVGVIDPGSLDEYRAVGGYSALRKAIARGPAWVVGQVNQARLRGRGGAGFPTGRKWEAVAATTERPHYLVCNADESEPGTFKDRVLMEEDPFALIEAMTLAGFAVGAERGFIYIRGEFPLATSRLRNAISQAAARGFVGNNVMGAGFGFEIEIRRGAGAYICGEETALLNSIEGYRGEPRNRPPFPSQAGLFGKPTVINNVETLVNVLDIVDGGAEKFAEIGTRHSTGTKLFCVSGSVIRPGLYEAPFGIRLRELLERAGGVGEGRELRAVLVGGAAGRFVSPDDLDVALTFEGLEEVGAALGSGAVIAFDDTVDMTPIVLGIAAFFRDESCGQCVPCRVGTVRQEEALHRLVSASSGNGEIENLDDVAQVMRDASICGLGQTAADAVQSALSLGLLGKIRP